MFRQIQFARNQLGRQPAAERAHDIKLAWRQHRFGPGARAGIVDELIGQKYFAGQHTAKRMGEHFGRRTLGNEAHRTGLNAGDDGAGLFDPGYHDHCQIRRDSAQLLDRIQTEFGLKAQIE